MRPDPARVEDIAWQIAFRLGFPLARIWWRLRRRRHEGALVAIHVGQSLLLLRSSYRAAWNFPGGSVRQGETPELAIRRELAEEIGLVTDVPLRRVGEVGGVWDGRRDRVFLFVLQLDRLPTLRLDNREIIGARLVPIDDLHKLPLTGPVQAYISLTDQAPRNGDEKLVQERLRGFRTCAQPLWSDDERKDRHGTEPQHGRPESLGGETSLSPPVPGGPTKERGECNDQDQQDELHGSQGGISR
jgi:8-oxo-dGTP pyrophosphatase MutT (NUDIX family)